MRRLREPGCGWVTGSISGTLSDFLSAAPARSRMSRAASPGSDGTVVAAVVEFKAEGSYLYQGMMLDYEVNEAGDLDRLLLVQTQRRKLTSDRAYDAAMNQHEEDTNRFYLIAGDVFVLRYDEIRTLNVTYLSLGSSGV